MKASVSTGPGPGPRGQTCFRFGSISEHFSDRTQSMCSICSIFDYCRTLFFRCILISRFSYVENSLHFNFADFPVGPILARMH